MVLAFLYVISGVDVCMLLVWVSLVRRKIPEQPRRSYGPNKWLMVSEYPNITLAYAGLARTTLRSGSNFSYFIGASYTTRHAAPAPTEAASYFRQL